MRDHDGAGKVWDGAFADGNIANATLVNIDAHDDLAVHLPLPTNFQEVRQSEFEVGSFIVPRMKVGIIGTYYWVKPKRLIVPQAHVPNPLIDAAVLKYPESVRIEELKAVADIHIVDEVPAIPADLLSIDLDYFTYDLSAYTPDFILKASVKRYLLYVFRTIPKPKIITIATSPGYTQANRKRVLLEASLEVVHGTFT